jgi:hypothetical protein
MDATADTSEHRNKKKFVLSGCMPCVMNQYGRNEDHATNINSPI